MVRVTQPMSARWKDGIHSQSYLSRSFSSVESVCSRLNSDHLPKVHVHPESQSVTFLGIRVFGDAIKVRISQ